MNVIRFSDLCAQGAVRGQRVLIRSDLNVPLDAHGQIREDTRVRASLGAIQMALQAGAAAVLVTSHLGRPKEGALQPGESLAPVAQRLAELLGRDVPLQKNWLAGNIPTPASSVLLLENCRGNPGEKANDAQLAQQLAQMCDIFVHDAFGTAHRMEASTHGVAQYARLVCAGPLLCAEIDAITRALARPARPLVAIVGGSKVSTKLDVLLSLAQKVDRLIVGGGIANTFLLAAGHHIGKSLAEPGMLDQARAVMEAMAARGAEVPLPQDVVLAKNFAPDAAARSSSVDAVQADEMILDIGPKTAAQLAGILGGAQTIVWNGPVGVFEYPAFGQGTETLARAIATSPAFSLAGGGDTLAAIAQYNIADRIGYISTGGGAFLEMLEGKTLPALDILQRRAQDSVKNS